MNSGINPKEKDYELARENTVAMNCHFLVCGIISIAYFVEFFCFVFFNFHNCIFY